MYNLSSPKLAMAGFLALIASGAVAQQQPQNVRIRGTIEKVDGNAITIKTRDGNDVTVNHPANGRVMAFVKSSMTDIKPNSYIGVTAMPQADGSQKAIAIHIFMESQRGTGEGHRPWDLRPNSTMTNAAVDNVVSGVDGQVITVKYKDGEKKVLVSPETQIVAFAEGDKSELKPGTPVNFFAQKQADGTLTAQSISIGRGVTPPM
jgi:hypothetical protein